MENFIKHISIDNFKSIQHLEITELNRINLFIGRPNVGKSNILEALSCFCIHFLFSNNSTKKLTSFIRLEKSSEIFYDGNIEEEAQIKIEYIDDKANLEDDVKEVFRQVKINFNRNSGNLKFDFQGEEVEFDIDQKLYSFNTQIGFWDVKSYSFSQSISRDTDSFDTAGFPFSYPPFLYPPSGKNLEYVIELLPELRKQFAYWFSQYGLKLVLDRASHSIKVLKEKGDEVFILPYSSIADTLQRIIFYKTAVASNENSVLIFEEPEAHAFPPYIVEFTQDVIASKTNQFLIATHSPLIVNDFLENARDDLAIFMVDFKNGQTVVRPLSKAEIFEVYKYGVDLFFNNEAYLA